MNPFTGPYALLAKIGAGILLVALLFGALVWWGNTRYNSGVSDTDDKWRLAGERLKQKAAVAAEEADTKAEQRVEAFTAEVAAEKEKLDEAEQNGSSGFDVLFGAGGV